MLPSRKVQVSTYEATDVLDALEDLVEASLLTKERSKDGQTRFGLLQSIAEYADMKMEDVPCDRDDLLLRHALYFGQMGSGQRLDALDEDLQVFTHFRKELQNFILGTEATDDEAVVGCCAAALKILRLHDHSHWG